MSRLERGVLDRFFNGYLLKKREIGKPFKYINSVPFRYNKWIESIFFPRNKFEQMYSSLVESMMPTLQYFMWNDLTSSARAEGWTIQEKLHFNFFRNRNVHFHAMGQSIHPFGYLERQRADAFYRRVDTIIPGIELPDWAQHTNRAPNYDFESVARMFETYRNVYEESTPIPHYNTPNYFAIQHFGNQRFFMGYWGQRLFYNEKPTGNYVYNTGKTTKEDLELMNSWYGSCRFNTRERLNLMSNEEKERYVQSSKKWEQIIDTHFPEFANIVPEPSNHKFDEPNYERNMEDIRDAIFAKKCSEILGSGVFTQSDIQGLYEFFLSGGEGDHNLFVYNNEDKTFNGTELYHKFITAFNIPDVFRIQKACARTPEDTFTDRLDRNWGINYNTVSTYRKLVTKLTSNFKPEEFGESVTSRDREVRNFITEEVFNSLFREAVKQAFGVSGNLNQGESVVVEAFKRDNNAFEQLHRLQEESRNAYPIASRQSRKYFAGKIRELLRTRPFDPSL